VTSNQLTKQPRQAESNKEKSDDEVFRSFLVLTGTDSAFNE